MRSDFVSKDIDVKPSDRCLHDSNIGFSTNFSRNGDVDKWTYFDGIYTYGCWGGFLFGTLYGKTGTIGRHEVFMPVDAKDYYFIKIVMKYIPIQRVREQKLPTTSKLYWRTLADSNWTESKSISFTLHPDGKWHTYILNVGVEPYWIGEINDLRLAITTDNGVDGDQFLIRQISIFSINSPVCRNPGCDYFLNYSPDCLGVGARACISSEAHPADAVFNIFHDETIVININGYGDEIFSFGEDLQNASGHRVALGLTKLISSVNIGGYAEARAVFRDNKFHIYTGTYSPQSSVVVLDGTVARKLRFFDDRGQPTSSFSPGRYPASGFSPLSSYRISTNYLLWLFDGSGSSSINFNPGAYAIEGGNRNVYGTLGMTSRVLGEGTVKNDQDAGRALQRTYHVIENAGSTVIDFNNPFNASGRIKKICAAITLDPPNYSIKTKRNEYAYETYRISNELNNAKILIFRPKKNGSLEVIHEISIPNRIRGVNKLYSTFQEFVEIDVDLYVHKGDLLGIYNAHVYTGLTFVGKEIDAQFFQISGKPSGVFNPGKLRGHGSSGLLIYARSDEVQERLVIDIDLQKRYNLESIRVNGSSSKKMLEYNLCRCLDMGQFIGDTFGLSHFTTFKTIIYPGDYVYQRPNVMYGLNRLTDGITAVKDGLAADSFTIVGDWYGGYNESVEDAGPGEVPTNPYYFWINGDHEWLSVYLHAQWFMYKQQIVGFDRDPFALTLVFPYGKEQTITKCKIFFKEEYNFRSWAYSIYKGEYYAQGNADDKRFDYITDIIRVTLDGVVYEKGLSNYNRIDKYLFVNPFIGHPINQFERVEFQRDQEFGFMSVIAAGRIVNDEQFTQARNIDWRVIEHEWLPVKARGFRIYCDYHKSTKIAEIEVYGAVPVESSDFCGSVNLLFSDYGSTWWPAESLELSENSVEFVIGDAPRYLRMEFTPTIETRYSDVSLHINTNSFYAGRKGCVYEYYAASAKRGAIGDSQVIELKNIYDTPYDLYVDIASETVEDVGLIFYSTLDSPDSVYNPAVGPDAIYIKEDDYQLLSRNRNCAINSHCWGLRNLIDGKKGYYKNSDISALVPFGVLSHNQTINYRNVGASNRSVLKIPVLSRNRYWKIAAKNYGTKFNVREMRVFRNGEVLDAEFYYEHGESRYINLCQTEVGWPGASSMNSSYSSVNAFDGNLSTFWESSTSYGGVNSWLAFTFESPTIVHALKLNSPGIQYIPQLFVFQASVSGTFSGSDVVDLGLFNQISSHAHSYDYYVCNPYWFYNNDTGMVEFFYKMHENITPYKYYRIYMPTGLSNRYYSNFSGGFRISEMMLLRLTAYKDFYTKPLDRKAEHLSNGSVTGSYYQIFRDNCIGFDLGSQKEIDAIEFYHDAVQEIEDQFANHCWNINCEGMSKVVFDDFCGIDTATWLYLEAKGDRNNFIIRDKSYYNHQITLGSGVVKENDFEYVTISGYSFSENFSDCSSLLDWFARQQGRFLCVNSGTESYIQFDFSLDGSAASYSKVFRASPGANYTQFNINENTAFKVRFKVSFDSFYMRYEGTDRSGNISIGLIGGYNTAVPGRHGGVFLDVYTVEYPYKQGVSLRLNDKWSDGLTSIDANFYSATLIPTSSGALSLNVPYFIEITGDGNYNYGAKIWLDDWGSSNLLGSANVRYYNPISASEIGLFYRAGYANYSGKIWEVHVDYINQSTSKKQVGGSIAFSGEPITIPNNYGMILKGKSFLIDFYVLFYELPRPGLAVELFRCKDGTVRFTIENVSGVFQFRLYASGFSTHTRNFDVFVNQWYHVCVMGFRGSYSSNYAYYQILLDGAGGYEYGSISDFNNFASITSYDFEIGRNLKGLLSNFRFSSDTLNVTRGFGRTAYPLPLGEYNHKYSFTIYCSADNISFGKYADVDLFKEYADVYYFPETIMASFYNSYFLVDLGQRHWLDIIRNYGVTDAYNIDKRKYITYSSTDTDNFDEVNFNYVEDISDNFSGLFKPDTFLWSYEDNPDLYLDGGKLRLKVDGNLRTLQELRSKYGLVGDFDIQIEYQILSGFTTRSQIGFFVEDTVTSGQAGIQRRYDSSYSNSYFATDQTDAMLFYSPTTDLAGELRLRRRGQSLKAYFKRAGQWMLLHHWPTWSFADVQVVLQVYAISLPSEVYLDNFSASLANNANLEGYKNARWVRINLPNGDATVRRVYKLGIYPDISVNVIKDYDKHNTYWDYLGPAITDYTEGINFAFGATVSGSSFVPGMPYYYLVDGNYSESLNDCWGSAAEKTPWIVIDLGEIRNIYRIKIYHGFSSTISDILAQDYQIQYSTNGTVFTTLFSITNNSSLVRTHDVASAVAMRYVKIYVTRYKSVLVHKRAGDDYVLFNGVCFREIEVYGDYGYRIINSEQYPIIALNLRKQFFLASDHQLIGVDAENTTTDWTAVSGSFAYGEAPFSDPQKVVFRDFGGPPRYDQWIAIKQNTATAYNDGPDYLKHAIIKSQEALNPCDYYWWWYSGISTISRGYSEVAFSNFPLKIEYPPSSTADIIGLRRGASFGVDSFLSWRDGLHFRLHIDDIDKLDLSYGYFFIRGKDGTSTHSDLEYRWYFTTYSGLGLFKSGWISPFLQFKYADEVIYNKESSLARGENPLILYKAEFDSIGMVFRGKGQPITMYFDGANFGRNHFESYSKFGQGLYLTGNEVLTAPIGGFDLYSGTIEFWFRPDYNFSGVDYAGVFKFRSVFHFGNSSGDVFGMAVASPGLLIYYGQKDAVRVFAIGGLGVIDVDKLLHVGIVYSANGQATGDGSTIKVFINNVLVGENFDTWDVVDNKLFKFTLGGQSLLTLKLPEANFEASSVDGVISEFKIYNFCKKNFDASLMNLPLEEKASRLTLPKELIEISKDNVTFYKVDDPHLPFVFKNVAPGAIVSIYYRVNLPKNLTGAEKRTSAIVASWDIGV